MKPPCLPQHDPDPAARALALAEARGRHVFDRTLLPPLSLCRALPEDEQPGLADLAGRLADGAGAAARFVALKLRTLVDRFDHIQDYEDLLAFQPRPAIVSSWRSDLAFAEQRLSGVATRVLRRIDHLPDHLPLDPAVFAGIAGCSLAEAEAEGRLFLADYDLLDGLAPGGARDGSKFVYAPLALFTWQHDPDSLRDAPPARRGHLIPVAIQLDQRPTRTNLYTPRDRLDWLLARIVVQNADFTVAQLAHHFGRAHLGMSAIAVAAARQLADDHPIARLLRPHQRHMLVQGELARRHHLAPGGPVERLYGPTLEGSLELIGRAHRRWRLDESSFPRDLELRGLAGDSLPHYPWRDDGRLVWDALAGFVGAYVRLAYASEAELGADLELRAFLDELADPGGAGLQGLPLELTRAALADLLTDIVFTNGPVHSAMSYPQAEYATFVPNYPAALYSPMPAVRGAANEADLLAMLPPQDPSLAQIELVTLLTAPPQRHFGHYDEDDRLHDPPELHELVVQFQERLVSAEQKIADRNRDRPAPYLGLLPSAMTGSPSV